MSKIIIVGHPDSGLTQIEDQLFRYGMETPNPSCRDNLSAVEVIATICKAMQLPNVNEVTNLSDYKQHRPEPVWDDHLLDLMRCNLKHEFWGWADSQALFLLDCLIDLNLELTFILVYDTPKNALLNPCRGLKSSIAENVSQEKLDHWTAYNAALLHFFLRNQKSCLLVNSKGVQLAEEKFFSLLEARLNRSLQVSQNEYQAEFSPRAITHSSIDDSAIDNLLDGTLHLSNLPSHWAAEDFFANDAESFIMGHYLSQDSPSQQIYEELEASSDLSSAYNDALPSSSAEAAWKAFLKQRWFTSQLVGRMYKDRQILTSEIQRLTENQTSLRNMSRSKEEKLHQLHEKLLELSLENSKLKQPSALTGAPERVMAQLNYRLGKIMIQQSKSLIGLLRMPLMLLKEKRNHDEMQIESYNEILPPLHEYADAHLAGDVIKNHLSYRLGSVIVDNSKSFFGWLIMPLSILTQIRRFRKQRAKIASETTNHHQSED